MRIDECDSSSTHNIRIDHILEESRFSHTCFPDNIGMSGSIYWLYSEFFCRTTKVGYPNRGIWFSYLREVVWWLEPTSCNPVHTRSFDIDSRHMHEPSEFCNIENIPFFWFRSHDTRRHLTWDLHDESILLRLWEYIHRTRELSEEYSISCMIFCFFSEHYRGFISILIFFSLGFLFMWSWLYMFMRCLFVSSVRSRQKPRDRDQYTKKKINHLSEKGNREKESLAPIG